MLVALYLVRVVSAFMRAAGAFNNVSSFDFGLALRKIREKNLFRVAVLARETQIPLSGGKLTNTLGSSIDYGREETGPTMFLSYKASREVQSRKSLRTHLLGLLFPRPDRNDFLDQGRIVRQQPRFWQSRR